MGDEKLTLADAEAIGEGLFDLITSAIEDLRGQRESISIDALAAHLGADLQHYTFGRDFFVSVAQEALDYAGYTTKREPSVRARRNRRK